MTIKTHHSNVFFMQTHLRGELNGAGRKSISIGMNCKGGGRVGHH